MFYFKSSTTPVMLFLTLLYKLQYYKKNYMSILTFDIKLNIHLFCMEVSE
jgi:hypothetical protein